jgi:hypothetical protein
MDLLSTVTGVKSSTSTISSSSSASSGDAAGSSAFASILSDVMSNAPAASSSTTVSSSSSSTQGTPTDDPATWAEMTMIDPSSGKAYYTPVDADVETALKDAVAKHIPGFDVDAVSDQTYISSADIRLNPVQAVAVNTSSASSSNPAISQVSSTPTIKSPDTQVAVSNVGSQSQTATGLSLAQSAATLLNNILNDVEANSTAQKQQDTPNVDTLIADLLKIKNNTNTSDNTSTLDRLLAS